MVAVKICGVCSPTDAALVAAHGADYIGVILAPGRTRTRTLDEARSIYDAAAGLRRVGVFVDASAGAVRRAAQQLRLDVVQLHGAESESDVAAVRGDWQVWKAVQVREPVAVEQAVALYQDVADALLLDGWSSHAAGGAGIAFAWDDIAPLRATWPASLALVAAGGLRPDNVAAVIASLRPAIVDVSSGVEAALCAKSPDKVKDFISAARAADRAKLLP